MIHPRDYKNGHVMTFDSRICIFILQKKKKKKKKSAMLVGRDGKTTFEKSENHDMIT